MRGERSPQPRLSGEGRKPDAPFLLARACPELAEGFSGLQPRIGVRGRLFAGETMLCTLRFFILRGGVRNPHDRIPNAVALHEEYNVVPHPTQQTERALT